MYARFGKLPSAMDEMDLTGNTLIVVWGDHGWHLGDHGIWCKHTNCEQATRIPLIISGPSLAKGRAGALVEIVDLYPRSPNSPRFPHPPASKAAASLPRFAIRPPRRWIM
jgi:iduronate 2-sulfatase